VPVRLVGSWAADLPDYPAAGLKAGQYKLTFGPDSMRWVVPGGVLVVSQPVSVSGNRITFRSSTFCRGPSGTYIWHVSRRKKLTFKNVSDTCSKRVVQMLRVWTKIFP
jgi:hypothetical protein